ncbi:MAG: hypothetical protein GW818_02685, partial [Flavobacteriales bacterium]|nr:hypothetical protein [Flavobacteriales bacterium]
MNNNNLKILLPLIIALSVVIGLYLGSFLSNTTGNKSLIFSNQKNTNKVGKLNEILNFIEESYVDSVDGK